MIRKLTVNEIEQEPNFGSLLAAYAAESSIDGMPKYDPQMELYRGIEASGMLHLFGYYQGDELAGFITILVTLVAHYGSPIATTESFFVAREHRSSGAGIRLLRAAEDHARTLGAVGFFVSAPVGGRLAHVMEFMPSYRPSNQVFFRSLSNV